MISLWIKLSLGSVPMQVTVTQCLHSLRPDAIKPSLPRETDFTISRFGELAENLSGSCREVAGELRVSQALHLTHLQWSRSCWGLDYGTDGGGQESQAVPAGSQPSELASKSRAGRPTD